MELGGTSSGRRPILVEPSGLVGSSSGGDPADREPNGSERERHSTFRNFGLGIVAMRLAGGSVPWWCPRLEFRASMVRARRIQLPIQDRDLLPTQNFNGDAGEKNLVDARLLSERTRRSFARRLRR